MTRGRPLVSIFTSVLLVAFAPVAAGPSPQARSATEVRLSFSISLAVPTTWTSTTPIIAQALTDHRPVVDATGLKLQEDGSLAVFRPAKLAGEASLIIMVLPTNVGQEALLAMSEAEVASAERRWFRPEAEQAAANTGRRITAWLGTGKVTIGGRQGLLTRYAFTRADGPPLRKETYAIYLGHKQVVFHIHLPAGTGTPVEAEVRQILASARIATAYLQ